MTTQIDNWSETWKDFNEAVERNKDIPAEVWMQFWLQKQITLAKEEEYEIGYRDGQSSKIADYTVQLKVVKMIEEEAKLPIEETKE